MASQVGGDLSQIRTGPCHVQFNSADVGHTMGGVTFNPEPNYRDRNVDEYGTSLADAIDQGSNVSVKTKLAEKTMKTLQLAYQFGSQVDTTTQGFGKVPGTKASSLAQELRLHPLDVVGDQEDIVIHKAYVSEVSEIQVGTVEEDIAFEVTLRGIIDESQADGQLLATIGGPTPAP